MFRVNKILVDESKSQTVQLSFFLWLWHKTPIFLEFDPTVDRPERPLVAEGILTIQTHGKLSLTAF